MKVREVVKLIEADRWYYISSTGSHRHFKHPAKKGKVTIPGHPNDDVHPKLFASILRQAQLERK